MENIITINPITKAEIKFLDTRLAKHTEQIFRIYQDAATFADKKNREIASILATIKTEKSYEKDGFTSVADYAAATFGIKKANSYALSTAGEIYNNPQTPAKVKALSPSKLVELAKVPVEEIAKSIESGEITDKTTQRELREYAKAKTKSISDKPIIVPRYTARPVSDTIPALNKVFTELHTIDEFDQIITEFIQENNLSVLPVEIVKLSKGKHKDRLDAEKNTINRRLYITESFSLVLEFYEPKPPKTDKRPSKVTKFTREQLLEMLQKMDETGATDYIDSIET